MLLVSGCNSVGVGLYLVDEEAGAVVECVLEGEYRGVARHGGLVYAASGDARSKERLVRAFNPAAGWAEVYRCPEVGDWHGLVESEGYLYAVDAARDLALRLTPELECVGRAEVSPGQRIHVNDIWPLGHDCFLTSSFKLGLGTWRFGGGPPQPLCGADMPIEQPHSICRVGRLVWACASQTSRVVALEYPAGDDGPPRWAVDWPVPGAGYPRGLLVEPAGLWVGVSRARHGGTDGKRGALVRLEPDGTAGRTIDLPCREVYAVVRWPRTPS